MAGAPRLRPSGLVDALPYAVLACTADLRVQVWSGGAQRLYGWPPAEVTGRRLDELMLSGQSDPAAVSVLAALSSGTRYAGSCLHRRRDGSEFTAHTLVGPADEMDPGAGAVLLAAEVSAVLPAEAQRRAQDLARFASLVQNGTDLALICDGDVVIRYASPAVSRLYGYRPEAVVGVSGWDFVHPDDQMWLRAFWARVLAAPGTYGPVEFRALAADGTWRWSEEFMTNLLDDPVVHGVVVNLRDVTRQRQAADALAASERRYRSIIQTAQEGVCVVDPTGRTVLANEKAAELLGVALAELQAGFLTDYLDPGSAEIVGRQLAERATGAAASYELAVCRRDGRQVWFSVAASPLYEDGTYVGSLGMISDITERKQLELQLTHLSLHDPLTGLPNRALLADRLQRTLDRQPADGGVVAVLFCNVDRFKWVNDVHGHLAGDDLLAAVARRITAALPATTTVARFGGDEFVVVVERVADLDHALGLADVVVDAVSDPFPLDGSDVAVTMSIGVATCPPSEPATLLRDADAALSLAKSRGRARVEQFTPGLRDAVADRLRLSGKLRGAAGRGELRVHYQPVLSLATGTVVGLEALVRWQHPDRGLLSPAQFVPVAEDTGLIREIDEWTLREACRCLARWRRRLPAGETLQVMVNLSAREVGDADLLARVRAALAAADLPPASLTIEVTETAVMLDQAGTGRSLAALSELGVQIAIDDFGTGYSPLLYLKHFPVHKLKVDRGFVAGLADNDDDRAIVTSLVSLAAAVNAVVVAEGVETHEQLEVLTGLGCQLGQGYLWSPAVPADSVPDLLARLSAEPVFALRLRRPQDDGSAAAAHLGDQPLLAPLLPADGGQRLATQILALHQAGASLTTIAAAVNRDGWKTAKGTEWRAITVAHTIRDLIQHDRPPAT